MISFVTWVYCVVAIVASAVGFILVAWMRNALRHHKRVQDRLRDLANQSVRTELTDFLRIRQVVGDADIREGVVFAPVPPERLEPLAMVLANAASMIFRMQNKAASSIYIRDSTNDRFMLLNGLDLDDLLDAARVMQRVAEDRRKSRSLYKGMTDDELRAIVRAGLSQWWKDQGNFESSNAIMSGDWDDATEFEAAYAVLDLFFKVKGASNG